MSDQITVTYERGTHGIIVSVTGTKVIPVHKPYPGPEYHLRDAVEDNGTRHSSIKIPFHRVVCVTE